MVTGVDGLPGKLAVQLAMLESRLDPENVMIQNQRMVEQTVQLEVLPVPLRVE